MNTIVATMSDVTQGANVDKSGYKWIAREIEKLDPERDYTTIWALSATYYVDDFFMNYLYTTGIQYFTQPPAGSFIMGQYTKKAVDHMQQRTHDTLCRFWQWFSLGPDHPDVKRSMEVVNSIHMALAKKNPGVFPSRDFTYTCCWIAADIHRLRLRLGLAGYTEKQKVAAHRFWQRLCVQFRSEEGQVADFPDSFDGILRLLAEYEAEPWEKVASGKLLSDALMKQFCERWFPPGLRWVGRQLLLSNQPKFLRDLMAMGDPNPLLAPVMRGIFKAVFILKEKVLPDPKLSTPERARLKRNRPGQHVDPPMAKISACPFHPQDAASRQ